MEWVAAFRHVESIPIIAEEGIRSDANGITVCDLHSILCSFTDWTDLIDAVNSLLGFTHCAGNLLDSVHVEKIRLCVRTQTPHCRVTDAFVENLGQDLADVLTAKIFAN